MEEHQQAIERVKLVQKSAEVARRVSAGRADASKTAARLMIRGLLPAHLGDESTWAADNAAPSASAPGRGVREALADCVAPLAEGALIGGVLPSTLATLLLAAYDTELRCPLERIPQPDVSVVRVLAHVESLGLSLKPSLAAQVARRATLVLLSHVKQRRPIVLPPTVRPSDDPPEAEAPPSEAADAVTSPAAQAGRQVRGYVRVSGNIGWAAGVVETPVGTVLEALLADERERESLQRDQARSQPSVVVWWDGRARVVPKEAVTPSSRSAWVSWCKEQNT